ncbi:MAG: alkaline phosphatase D family protein, partial [Gemmatimonadales bacterium]
YNMDKWSGYERERNRLLGFLHDRQVPNPVVLTGDIHSNWVNDLKLDFRDMRSPTVASEFVGTSLSSGGDGSDTRPPTEGLYSRNPFVKFWNGQRGYVRCRVTPGLWTSDYRVVDYVTRRGSPISTRASFVVEEGKAGVVQA